MCSRFSRIDDWLGRHAGESLVPADELPEPIAKNGRDSTHVTQRSLLLVEDQILWLPGELDRLPLNLDNEIEAGLAADSIVLAKLSDGS